MIKLKVFIWLCCFFVVAAFQTAALEAGVTLGAIPAMLLFGLAWWSAKKLCARWDQRQAERAALAASEPAPPIAESEPTIADPSISAPTTPKLRFCKLCGSPIDTATRKCAGCGKQYFRPPVFRKKHLFIAAGVLACAAVVFLVFSLVSQKDAAQAQVDDLNARITELEEKVAEQERQISVYKKNEISYRTQLSNKDTTIKGLRDKNTTLGYKLDFFNEHVVFIPDDGSNTYHIHGCQYSDLFSHGFYAYNTENAEYHGYKPCSHCCG